MKKVISILMAIMMISTTVLADTADGFKEFFVRQSEIQSFTGKSVLNIDVNKPLDILDYIPVDEDINIDYAFMIRDMLDSEVTVNYAYNLSKDYKKLQMSMDCEFDVPVHINDSFKLDAWAKTGVWYNYDLSDEKNPVFEIIVKTPFSSKYLVGDIGKEFGPELASVMNADTVKKTAEAMADAINKNASVEKTSKGYKIKFDSDGLGGFLNSWLGVVGEYLPESEKKEFESAMQEMGEIFSGIDFLGEEGLTISITKNSKGELTACVEEMHIDFNVCDVAELVGGSIDGLLRDDAQIDVTLCTTTEISEINKTKVILPELTDDNTTPMFSEYSDSLHIADKPPLFINDIIYYPVNEVIEKSYATIAIDGNKVIFGDAVLECDATQLIIVENEVYVTEDVLEFIGVDYTSVSYDTYDKTFRFIFEYYEEDEDYAYDEPVEDYESEYSFFAFDIDRAPYVQDGVYYMPVYEFINEVGDGEFDFGYKSLKFTATKENPDGISTFTVNHGDRFVTVNGEKIEIEAPAVEVEGVLNIPATFAGTYGYSGSINTSISIANDNNAYTSYFFDKENELYPDEEETPVLWVDVYSDRLPYVENGEVCVPLYDFLLEMYDGEFSFTDTGMEYTATSENEYGITKVSVTVDDKFVTVDDRKIDLENKVVRVDGVIRVPIGFTEALGFETDWITVYDDSTSYSFSMQNPNYREE